MSMQNAFVAKATAFFSLQGLGPKILKAAVGAGLLAACSAPDGELPPAYLTPEETVDAVEYRIGPLDNIEIFVWRQPDLSVKLTVRPDGHISMPLLNDMVAAGKTANELAEDIEEALAANIRNPEVSVMTLSFNGTFGQQVRVIGEAANPQAMQYQSNMTLLDAIIRVGGLTEQAAGNRARLVRFEDGVKKEYGVKIETLIYNGDVDANVRLRPGDVIIIPGKIF